MRTTSYFNDSENEADETRFHLSFFEKVQADYFGLPNLRPNWIVLVVFPLKQTTTMLKFCHDSQPSLRKFFSAFTMFFMIPIGISV